MIADRLDAEVSWLRQAAGRLTVLDTGRYPPVVNLRPDQDWPDAANVAVTLARVAGCWTAAMDTSWNSAAAPVWDAPTTSNSAASR